jgi:6-phosphogluconolactonase (cycloisomerase 2 family)
MCALAPRIRGGFFVGLALALVLAGCGSSQTQNCLTCHHLSGAQFLLATTSTGQILRFPINATAGLGAPATIPGPANSIGIAVGTPSGGATFQNFVYASDPKDNLIDAFSVSATDGSLSALPGSPFSLGTATGGPASLVVFGNNLYAASTDGGIVGFSIASSGSLTILSGSPFTAGAMPLQILPFPSTSVPNTTFFYAANFADANGSISAYSINPAGTLAPVSGSPFPTLSGSGPAGMLWNGSFLCVALEHSNAIAVFSVSGTGVLSPIPGSPFPAGHGTSSLAAGGGFLYALNDSDHTVSVYSSSSSSGSLAPIAGSPFSAGTASGQILYNNGFLYAPDPQAQAIQAFSINPMTGAPVPLSGSPFAAGAAPVALAIMGFPEIDPPK